MTTTDPKETAVMNPDGPLFRAPAPDPGGGDDVAAAADDALMHDTEVVPEGVQIVGHVSDAEALAVADAAFAAHDLDVPGEYAPPVRRWCTRWIHRGRTRYRYGKKWEPGMYPVTVIRDAREVDR